MRKILVTLVLLLCATCLLAQDNMSNSSATTIQGCLTAASGHYILTESNGTVHRLNGYANKLKDHVGHEVAITGMEGVKTTGTTQQGNASTAKQIPVFKVQSIKHVADSCKAQ